MLHRRDKIKTNIWVEKLGVIEILYFFIISMSSDIQVRYDEYNLSNGAKKSLSFLRKLKLAGNFYSANLTLDKPDAQGYSVYYRFCNNFDACLEDFISSKFDGKPKFFRRTLKSYLAFYLFNRATFIALAQEGESKNTPQRSRHILYLVRHPLNTVFISFYEKKGYTVKQSLFSYIDFKYLTRPLYHLFVLFAAAFLPGKVRHNISTVKPSIWIEYFRKSSLDMACWKDMLNRNDFDIVYYFDREDDPPLEVMVNDIEEQKFKWVELHFRSLVRLSNLGLGALFDIVNAFFRQPIFSRWWLRVFCFEERMWFLLYRAVFKQFKVKVLIQRQECSWVQAAQVKALDEAGGIMVGLHWSHHAYCKEPLIMSVQHVFFVWGKLMYECWQKREHLCRYFLPAGLWLLNNNSAHNQRIDFASKVNFIIAIFDGSGQYNIYATPEQLSEFFLKVLRLLENNPNWGGIIKSKYRNLDDFVYLMRGSEIQQRINALVAQKRLTVWPWDMHPFEAARHAHLSVCFAVNSAGIIAGIYGSRAIHWDCAGFLKHPIYRDKGQRIFYPDLNAFEEAIVEASKGNDAVGNFSSWAEKFDHYHDFLGPRRIGRFIQSFMQKSEAPPGDGDALSSAVEEYLAENKVDSDFFMDSGLWSSE